MVIRFFPVLRALFLVLIAAATASFSHGSGVIPSYYWSISGNDGNNCLTIETACQSIGHFNSFVFPANSVVAFKGGDTFSGGLVITADGMTVTSYGSGQPTFSTNNVTRCISAVDKTNITINNVVCTGGGNLTNNTDGIHIENSSSGSVVLAGPTITNTTVSGYGGSCIHIGVSATTGTASFSNTVVNNNIAHDCSGTVGSVSGTDVSGCIVPFGRAGSGNATAFNYITVHGNTAYNCIGNINGNTGSGFGIWLGAAKRGVIENNLIHDSGSVSNFSAGPVGIIVIGSDSIIVQFNEVYKIRTALGDGEGIDFDQGTGNSVIQYNYVHDNSLSELFMFGALSGNVIRFNMVQPQTSGENAISLEGNSASETIYNNTLNIGSTAGSCLSGSNTSTPVTWTFANNICMSSGGAEIFTNINLRSTPPGVLNLTGNDWFSSAGVNFMSLLINGTTYVNLAGLQIQGWEKVGGSNVGTDQNPSLTGTFPAATCGGYSTTCPPEYKLSSGTVAGKGKGVNLNSIYKYGVGVQDFYGNTIDPTTLPIGAAGNL